MSHQFDAYLPVVIGIVVPFPFGKMRFAVEICNPTPWPIVVAGNSVNVFRRSLHDWNLSSYGYGGSGFTNLLVNQGNDRCDGGFDRVQVLSAFLIVTRNES
jgi:hypothetical protein